MKQTVLKKENPSLLTLQVLIIEDDSIDAQWVQKALSDSQNIHFNVT